MAKKTPLEPKYAIRQLVRGSDGLLRVIYVDPKTGTPVKGNPSKYRIITSASDLSDIRGGRNNRRQKKEKDKGPAPTLPADIDHTDTWGRSSNSPVGNNPSKSDKGNTSGKGPATSRAQSPGFDSSEEQGDQEGGFTGSKNKAVAANDYGDFSVYDPGTTRGTVGAKNLKEQAAVNAKEDAQYSSLDGEGFSTINGNNPHPMEGQNLNDMTSNAAARNNWSAEDKALAAKTLAGEIDQRQTDLSTPEGIAEARAIMSTMENRDLANGPNKSLSDAINADKAYSTWNGPEEAKVAENNYAAKPDVFDGIVADYAADPNSNMGFTNYYNDKIVSPSWGENLEDAQNIGAHRFGIDPSIASKIPSGVPVTPDQVDQVATDVVNQNFMQSFAAPVGPTIAGTPPTIDTTGVQTDDMATGMAVQRDYTGPTVTAPTTDQRIVEAGPFGGPQVPGLTSVNAPVTATDSINNQVATDNAYGITQGQQIAATPPDGFAATPTETAGVTRSLGPVDGNISGQKYTTEPGLSNENFDSRFNSPESTAVSDQAGFDSRFNSPTVSASPTGVMGDPTTGYGTTDNQAMGFGDYVNTDQNANTGITEAQANTQEARINGAYENNNVGMLDAANAMASSPPSDAVADAANVADADAASAGAGAGTTSDSGMSTGGTEGGFGGDNGGGNADTDGGDSGGTSTSSSSGGGFASAADAEGDDGY